MAEQLRNFKIGLFTLVGVGLGVAGVVLLGAGEIFQKKVLVETYINSSVQGIATGTVVKYRGVPMGKVEAIDFVRNVYPMDMASDDFFASGQYVYVLIALTDRSITRVPTDQLAASLERMVKDGFRVRLAPQGLTGTAYLEMDYLRPQENPVFEPTWKPQHYHLPSAPGDVSRLLSNVEVIFDKIKEVDLKELLSNLNRAIVGINEYVENELTPATVAIKEGAQRLPAIAKNIEDLTVRVNVVVEDVQAVLKREVTPMLANVRKGSEKLPAILDKGGAITEELEHFLVTLNSATEKNIVPALEDISEAATDLPATLRQLKQTVNTINAMAAAGQADVLDILDSLRSILIDFRAITESAKSYPSHLLLGEPPPRQPKGTP